MLIISGKKRTRTRHGYVADFCPLCRDVREFAVWRLGRDFHLYWLSVNEAEFLGFEATCRTCGHLRPTLLEEYAHVSERRLPNLKSLELSTFPDLREVAAERLEVERTLQRGGTLPTEVRASLLREPFLELEPILRGRRPRLDISAAATGLIVLALLGATAAGMALAENPTAKLVFAGIFMVCGLVGGLLAIRVQDAESHRWFRKKAPARVARWLRPLRPNHDELRRIVDELAEAGVLAAKLTNVDRALSLMLAPEEVERLDPLPVVSNSAEEFSAPAPEEVELDPLSPRIAELREPFLAHAFELRDRGRRTRIDLIGLTAAALTVAVFAAGVMLAARIETQGPKLALMLMAIAVGLVGALLTLRLIDRESHRWFKRRLLPRVARSLLPLRPTRRELEQVVDRLREEGELIGQLTSADRLAELLEYPAELDRLDPSSHDR